MDRESDPSYLEWVRLKGSSSTATGQDVVELASKLIETLYEQLSEAQALHEASAREFGMHRSRFSIFVAYMSVRFSSSVR